VVEAVGKGAIEPGGAPGRNDREQHQGEQVQRVFPEVEVGVEQHQPDRADQHQCREGGEAGGDTEEQPDADDQFRGGEQDPEEPPVWEDHVAVERPERRDSSCSAQDSGSRDRGTGPRERGPRLRPQCPAVTPPGDLVGGAIPVVTGA